MDLDEFKTRVEQVGLDERLDRKIAAAKHALAIWMAALSAIAVSVTLLLARAIWHLRP